ncbi:MAG: diguanylate cyclase [Firmicutes bacterium]|nr:diguanylate cyclase [Bacillota bacterium]
MIKIAGILKASCTVEDSVIRLGGDEFAIIMNSTDESVATNVCSRIKNFCNLPSDDPVKPSIALGNATLYDKTISIEELVKQAEDRMNRSKLKLGWHGLSK